MRLQTLAIIALTLCGTTAANVYSERQAAQSGATTSDRMHGSLIPQSASSTFGREIRDRMVEWRQAVVAYDIQKLLALTWPESREGFGKDLKNPQSSLAKRLNTIARLLRRSDTQIFVFESVMFVDSSDYATGCYHLGRKKWPTMWLDLQKLNNGKDMFCLEWVKDERGSWTMSYGFAYDSSW